MHTFISAVKVAVFYAHSDFIDSHTHVQIFHMKVCIAIIHSNGYDLMVMKYYVINFVITIT